MPHWLPGLPAQWGPLRTAVPSPVGSCLSRWVISTVNAALAQGALRVGFMGSVLQMRRLRLRGERARSGSLRDTARTRTQSVELPRLCSVAPREGIHRGQAQRLSETGVPCPLLRTPGSRGPGPHPFLRLARAAPQMWLLVRRGSSFLPPQP